MTAALANARVGDFRNGDALVYRRLSDTPRPLHSRQAMLCPGQLSRCVPSGQQWPFELSQRAQTKTFFAP
jgi:hypothetical protein